VLIEFASSLCLVAAINVSAAVLVPTVVTASGADVVLSYNQYHIYEKLVAKPKNQILI
jgi:hypothetical protein